MLALVSQYRDFQEQIIKCEQLSPILSPEVVCNFTEDTDLSEANVTTISCGNIPVDIQKVVGSLPAKDVIVRESKN